MRPRAFAFLEESPGARRRHSTSRATVKNPLQQPGHLLADERQFLEAVLSTPWSSTFFFKIEWLVLSRDKL